MRVLVVMFAALLVFVGQVKAGEAPAHPDVSRIQTIHDAGSLKGLAFSTDSDAQALVDELLGYLGYKASYEIYVTDNAATTANALAGFDPTTKVRSIFFNRAFMQRYAVSTHDDLGLQFIAAHELAHLHALHSVRHIDSIQKEIEADYFAGFILGMKTGDCERVVAAISAFPDEAARLRTKTHPGLAQRRVAVGSGCADATGQLPPALANVDVHVNRPSILNQFRTLTNRDIYGSDLAAIDGKPGIPGSTLQSCAQVCFGLPDCKGFVFNQWKNFCYLKSDVKGESLLHPAGTLAVRKQLRFPLKSTSKDEAMAILMRTTFADTPLSETTTSDYETCRLACRRNKPCVAFSFYRATKSCRQFSVTEGYYADNGFDSGYKYQIPDIGWLSTLRASGQ